MMYLNGIYGAECARSDCVAPERLQEGDNAGSFAEATPVCQQRRSALGPQAAQPVDGLQLVRVQGSAMHPRGLGAQHSHTLLCPLRIGPSKHKFASHDMMLLHALS